MDLPLPIISAGRSQEKKEEVEAILKNIEDPNFWNQLAELKLFLEPLAIAANVSQAPTTRLDHILIKLGRLYNTFSRLVFNPKIRETVLASLERRWGKADQDPFILAVFFNPFIRARLFNRKNKLLSRSALYGAVKRVFKHIFWKENDLELYEAFLDYYDSRNEFSADMWDYQEQQAVYERAGKPLNMVNKVFDTAVVRTSLKRKHAAEGRTRSRLRQQFGTLEPDSAMTNIHAENNQSDELGEEIAGTDEDSEDSSIPDMRSLAMQFQRDVADDEDLPEDEGEVEIRVRANASTAPLPKKVRLFFGTQVAIPLQELFEYSSSTGAETHGLDIFKPSGLANLKRELELYGLATHERQKDLETDDLSD
ncbi:hypothetical protein RSOL_279600, partial [Rhizoctonia solani AG-3 Rhs1AP]